MNIADSPYKALGAILGTRFVGKNLLYFPRVTSTMNVARQEARKGAPEGTVVIAGEQTGGRGRRNRSWLTPSGNIALSVVLYPEVSCLPYLVMIASLAVVHYIESVAGLRAGIKWPNDILIEGKKVCGILIENEIGRSEKVRAVIGIGINIDIGSAVIEGSALPVTGLEMETGKAVDKVALVNSLLTEIERLYLQLPDGGAIFQEWKNKLITLGKRVEVTYNTEKFEGTAKSVDENGALTLKLDDNSLMTVVAGDVTLRQK
jgi:BirA family biotin operon repressor/biotin-[acetyl-CoA-carboxylase] ligase